MTNEEKGDLVTRVLRWKEQQESPPSDLTYEQRTEISDLAYRLASKSDDVLEGSKKLAKLLADNTLVAAELADITRNAESVNVSLWRMHSILGV